MAKTAVVRVRCTECRKMPKLRVSVPIKAGKTTHTVICPLCVRQFQTTIDWGSSHEVPDDLRP